MLTGLRVSKELIHRADDREILVSPPWRDPDGTYGNATVTDDLSTYYRDHPRTHWADLLLLTEACRQAALSVTHHFEGLPRDIAFFFNSIAVEIPDIQALVDVRREMTITTLIERMRLRGDGSPKQLLYTQLGSLGPGELTVRTVMAVQGAPKDRYQELRRYERDGSAPPTTASLRDRMRHQDGLSAPTTVGRTQPTNVVLADLRIGPERSSATLAPDFANPSLFDHDYDHYPAMVLIEAGRQLALAGTQAPSHWVATGVRAEFVHFAELDRTATVSARRHGHRTEVECSQHDVTVARMSFDLQSIGVAA